MPQLSLDPDSEVHELRIHVKLSERTQTTTVMLMALNRKSVMLASSGLVVRGYREAELLPILAAEAMYGWLYKGAKECVTTPANSFRSRRKDLAD